MIYQVFSVYDSKAEEYSPPFFAKTVGLALRDFESAASNEESYISRNPEDYTLFHISEWDSDNATFIPKSTPISLGVAVEFSSNP